MKKSRVLLIALCASVLVACDNTAETHKANVTNENPVVSVFPDGTFNKKMPELARQYNCTACHAIDKKVVGPSWMAVSKKYKGDATAEAKLIAKVSKGGSGVWGSMPMPANDAGGIHQAEMKELVRFVLSLDK